MERLRRLRRRLGSASGQSFAEFAATSGILVALGIVISLTLNATMKLMVRGIANAVRTMAP